jgi:hypothetical protein
MRKRWRSVTFSRDSKGLRKRMRTTTSWRWIWENLGRRRVGATTDRTVPEEEEEGDEENEENNGKFTFCVCIEYFER